MEKIVQHRTHIERTLYLVFLFDHSILFIGDAHD